MSYNIPADHHGPTPEEARNPPGKARPVLNRRDFLGELADANIQRAPDFNAGGIWEWSPAERGNELAGETGELCNELKKLLRHCKRFGVDYRDAIKDPHNVEQMAKIRAELGDVVICASLIAVQLDIDLEQATREKFNATSDKIGSGVKL